MPSRSDKAIGRGVTWSWTRFNTMLAHSAATFA